MCHRLVHPTVNMFSTTLSPFLYPNLTSTAIKPYKIQQETELLSLIVGLDAMTSNTHNTAIQTARLTAF